MRLSAVDRTAGRRTRRVEVKHLSVWSEPWVVDGAAVRVSQVCFSGANSAAGAFARGLRAIHAPALIAIGSCDGGRPAAATEPDELAAHGWMAAVRADGPGIAVIRTGETMMRAVAVFVGRAARGAAHRHYRPAAGSGR